MFGELFDLSKYQDTKMCIFISGAYVRAWFLAPLPSHVPRNDLDYQIALYKNCRLGSIGGQHCRNSLIARGISPQLGSYHKRRISNPPTPLPPLFKPPNFKSTNAATNLTSPNLIEPLILMVMDTGGYGVAAVLKFGICGCCTPPPQMLI